MIKRKSRDVQNGLETFVFLIQLYLYVTTFAAIMLNASLSVSVSVSALARSLCLHNKLISCDDVHGEAIIKTTTSTSGGHPIYLCC